MAATGEESETFLHQLRMVGSFDAGRDSHLLPPEKKLHLRVMRLTGAPHLDESSVACSDREVLDSIKQRADMSRVTRIPAIRKI